jgi:hypothetical protein
MLPTFGELAFLVFDLVLPTRKKIIKVRFLLFKYYTLQSKHGKMFQ